MISVLAVRAYQTLFLTAFVKANQIEGFVMMLAHELLFKIFLHTYYYYQFKFILLTRHGCHIVYLNLK